MKRKWETIRQGTRGDKRPTLYSVDMWSAGSSGRACYVPCPTSDEFRTKAAHSNFDTKYN